MDSGRVHVHSRFQVYVNAQNDPIAGAHGRVAGPRGQGEVAGRDLRSPSATPIDMADEDGGGRVSLAMILLEVLGPDDAPFVGHVRPREWNAVPRVLRREVLVQDAERADCSGIGIRQQRIGYALAPREMAEQGGAIVADCGDAEPLGAKSGLGCLQLDELGLAERSPVARAEKQQHQPLGSSQGLEPARRPTR